MSSISSKTAESSARANEVLAIGIDLGGTKIAAGLVSFPTGKIVAKEIVPTLPERGGHAVLNDTVAVAGRLKDEATKRGAMVKGIGVGIAELVNLQGEITSEYLIKLRGLPAKTELSKVAPAEFESDARAPALAEALLGAGRGFRNFVYLTVGTGISYCLVLDGRPYPGAHGHAIMVASGALTSECPKCGEIHHQVLEEFAAGPSLVARYNQQTGSTFTMGQQVTAAAAAGDKTAIKILESSGLALGNSVGFLINVLDPEAVVVGGGLGLAGGLYWNSFEQSTRKHIWSDVSREIPIIKAQLGADAGLIGAAAMIWKTDAKQLNKSTR